MRSLQWYKRGDAYNHCDHCRDTLIENIADEGVNLWAENQYNDKIKSVVEGDKKKMISLLFGYKG